MAWDQAESVTFVTYVAYFLESIPMRGTREKGRNTVT